MLESPASATAVYELGLLEGSSGRTSSAYHAVGDDGTRRRLPLERWLSEPDAAELQLLAQVEGPVLDVGCGPGRHLVALGRRGIVAVGVDVSAGAAAIARQRGATVIEASIFNLDRPAAWATALLLDGNIGIGGDPAALLRRVSELLREGGVILVELDSHATASRISRVRLESSREISDWVPWTFVARAEIEAIAAAVGLRLDELWQRKGRWFARLQFEADG